MAVSSREISLGNDGYYDYIIDGVEVDAHTFVQTDPAARATYDKLMATGLWQFGQADELAMKTNLSSFYIQDANPWSGNGINQNPNTGGPETDTEKAKREAAEEKAALAKAAERKAKRDELNAKLDWRVRLHLGEGADFFYKDPDKKKRGILDPLAKTKGVVFPYTPTIGVQYNANYANYDLVHSNYKGYFYTGSSVPNVIVTADFTANDVVEANYLLASLHFLRSCTKMFYGQDGRRGIPPPVVFLTGYGEYQFKDHPCVISMVNYNLPNDVDYIPAGNVEGEEIRLDDSQGATETVKTSKDARVKGLGVTKGAKKVKAGAKDTTNTAVSGDNAIKIYEGLTYVPTKITINFTMMPIQTRDQVSNKFSLEDYASGNGLKKGMW